MITPRNVRIVLVSVATAIIVGFVGLQYYLGSSRERLFSGLVQECASSQPIAEAKVVISGLDRKFTFVPFPVWDFPVSTETKSGASGRFSSRLKADPGAVQITALKDGYLPAQQYESFDQGLIVGLVRESSDKSDGFTTRCKLSSECLVTTTEIRRGKPVTVVKSVCK